jgi:hypothetical protein
MDVFTYQGASDALHERNRFDGMGMVASPDFLFVAAACGVVCGIFGFLPLFFAARKVDPSMRTGVIGFGLICIGISLILMVGALLICRKVAPAYVFPFGMGMLAMFLVATLIYAIRYARRINSK